MLETIFSGGQTGADRAALDAAIQAGFPYDGWIPKGRRAEDGIIPDTYRLKETTTEQYEERTERNVQSTDATVIFSTEPLSGGTKLTESFTDIYKKYLLIINIQTNTIDNSSRQIKEWIKSNNIKTLNIAGPRQTDEPRVYPFVFSVISSIIRWAIANETQTEIIESDIGGDLFKRAFEIHKDADWQLHTRLAFFMGTQGFLFAAYMASWFSSIQDIQYFSIFRFFIIFIGVIFTIASGFSCRRLIRGMEFIKSKYLCRLDPVYSEYLFTARKKIPILKKTGRVIVRIYTLPHFYFASVLFMWIAVIIFTAWLANAPSKILSHIP